LNPAEGEDSDEDAATTLREQHTMNTVPVEKPSEVLAGLRDGSIMFND
jgi:hypothetical protein